jgi:guanylate cyclase
VLSIGEYPGEPETKRSGRRVFLVAFLVATASSIPQVFADLENGYTWVAIANVATTVITIPLLVAINVWPRHFAGLVNAMLVMIFVSSLAEIAMFGGLLPSGLVVMFGLSFVLAAMLAISLRAAIWWFVAYVLSIVYAVVVPDWIDPIYVPSDPTADIAFNLIALGVLVLAVLGYFLRQRDRFQARSDELLHNILPDEIVARLKSSSDTIADDVDAASVLFADVVDFTPMSAALTPAELVGLLDEIFSVFDGFVGELGLEKIKTIGDAYMVAAGVPVARPDHAKAIAELALRIRDHAATSPVDGRPLSFRIGIHSGPVTAGIIGTHKFSYDLWGDTVNVASRMESGGVPGAIQISAATRDLIAEEYVCDPRGLVPVKGKDEMEAYLLVSRRATASPLPA